MKAIITRLTLVLCLVCAALCSPGQSLNFVTTENSLVTCGDPDSFYVELQSLSSDTLSNVLIQLNMPTGVLYQLGSVSGNATESNVSNPSAIQLAGTDILPFQNISFTVLLYANCSAVDTVGLRNFMTISHSNGLDGDSSGVYNLLQPTLSIQSVTPPAYSGNIGDTITRCVTLINGGFGYLQDAQMVIERDPAVLSYTNFRLSNGFVLTPTLSGDSIIFSFAGSDFVQVGNLDSLLDQNETLEICYDIELLDCGNGASDIAAFWGCYGDVCEVGTCHRKCRH